MFVFDTSILDALPSRVDRRIGFLWASLRELDEALDGLARGAGLAGGGLAIEVGLPQEVIPRLAAALGVACVCANRDYEPAARTRDGQVAARLEEVGIGFETFKDQVIFECDDVLSGARRPYSIFTPYCAAWMKALHRQGMPEYPVAPHAARLAVDPGRSRLPELTRLGFSDESLKRAPPAGMSAARDQSERFFGRIERYKVERDFPALDAGSRLSVHLRFGTISIRQLVRNALRHGGEGAQCWLTELVWREFYQMILWHHPRVVGENYRREFDSLVWERSPERFAAWCEGRTGYPIVDAAMRQFNATGWMHNRLRMVTASFLTKDLGIDWREGERYFADRLLDYDLAANNGGWQWVASTGCDAQPWFRIFNPATQSRRFDPEGLFVRGVLPELAALPRRFIHEPWKMNAAMQERTGVAIGRDYPAPIANHALARLRTLERFARVVR